MRTVVGVDLAHGQDSAVVLVTMTRERYDELLELADLGAAWTAAEAKLPDGWRLYLETSERLASAPYYAQASPGYQGDVGHIERGDATPAAALRAVAADIPEPKPTCSACGHDATIHYDPTYRDADSVPECAGTGLDGLGCRCLLTPDQVRATAPEVA